MAHASRAVKLKRRLKREASIAHRMLDLALKQRDQARMIAYALEQELKKKEPTITVTEQEVHVEQSS